MENKGTDLSCYFNNIGIRPTFINNKIFGNLYVVENLKPYSKFPERFIAVSDKTNKFYFVDCVCCDEKEFVEYIFIEINFGDLYTMSRRNISLYDLCVKHLNDIYVYLEDWDGMIYEKNSFHELYEDGFIDENDYIGIKSKTFNKTLLIGMLLEDDIKRIE